MKKKGSTADGTDKFAECYSKYFGEVFRYVNHRVSDVQLAEDITQETFYAAFKKGADFLKHPYPRRWLFRTAKYKVNELCRKMDHWKEVSLESDASELAREDFGYEVKELEVAVPAILSEDDWKLFQNYHLNGVTISELARMNGITENNMRVRLTRLKQKLRNGLRG